MTTLLKGFATLFLLAIHASLSAQTVTWIGDIMGGDGVSWEDGSNWSDGFVPDISDEILIENDSVSISANVDARRVDLMDAKLTILGRLNTNNADTFGIKLSNSTLHNLGRIDVEEAGDGEFGDQGIQLENNSICINDSLIQVFDAQGFGIRVEGSSMFTNNGFLKVTSTRTSLSIGTLSSFHNYDSIEIAGTSAPANGVSPSSAATFTNWNFLDITITDGGHGISVINGGGFTNEGQVFMDLQNSLRPIVMDAPGSSFIAKTNSIINGSANACRALIWILSGHLEIQDGASIHLTGTNLIDFMADMGTGSITIDGELSLN